MIEFQPIRLTDDASSELRAELDEKPGDRALETDLADRLAASLPFGMDSMLETTAEGIAAQLGRPALAGMICDAHYERRITAERALHAGIMDTFCTSAMQIVGPKTSSSELYG